MPSGAGGAGTPAEERELHPALRTARVSDEFKFPCGTFTPQKFRRKKCATCFFTLEEHSANAASPEPTIDKTEPKESVKEPDPPANRAPVQPAQNESPIALPDPEPVEPPPVVAMSTADDQPEPSLPTPKDNKKTSVPPLIKTEASMHLPKATTKTLADRVPTPQKLHHRQLSVPCSINTDEKPSIPSSKDTDAIAEPQPTKPSKTRKRSSRKHKEHVISQSFDLGELAEKPGSVSDNEDLSQSSPGKSGLFKRKRRSKAKSRRDTPDRFESDHVRALSEPPNLVVDLEPDSAPVPKEAPESSGQPRRSFFSRLRATDPQSSAPKEVRYHDLRKKEEKSLSRRAALNSLALSYLSESVRRLRPHILAYLRVSVFSCQYEPSKAKPAANWLQMIQQDGLGIRLQIVLEGSTDASNPSPTPVLPLPVKQRAYPTQWLIPLTQEMLENQPRLSCTIQDFSTDLPVGSVILPLDKLPYFHSSMTYGSIQTTSWTASSPIEGKIKIGLKLIQAKKSSVVHSEWNAGNSGGTFDFPSWIRSPQYPLHLPAKRYVAVVLTSDAGDHHELGFHLVRVPETLQDKLLDFSNINLIERSISRFDTSRRVDMELELDPGHYILLPSTFAPSIESPFTLSISAMDGMQSIHFTEDSNTSVACRPEADFDRPLDVAEDEDRTFLDGLDSVGSLQLSLKEVDENIDDLDWDMELDDTPAESTQLENNFDDGFGDDLDLSKLSLSVPQGADDETFDDFEDGFDFDAPRPAAPVENYDDGFDELDFDEGFSAEHALVLPAADQDDDDFDDAFDFDGPANPTTSVLSLPKNDPEVDDFDDFGDDFGGDFDLPVPSLPSEAGDNSPAASNDSDLFDAIEKGDVDRMDSLLRKTSSLKNEPDKRGIAPLLAVVQTGRLDLLKVLLSHDVDIDVVHPLTEASALSMAIELGHRDLVRFLVSVPCDPSRKDKQGETSACKALLCGDKETLRLLASTLPSFPCKAEEMASWNLTSFHFSPLGVNAPSILCSELMEVLEIACPYGGSTCIFQIVLYRSAVFRVNLVHGEADEATEWNGVAHALFDLVSMMVARTELSSVWLKSIERDFVLSVFSVSTERLQQLVDPTDTSLFHLLETDNPLTAPYPILDSVHYVSITRIQGDKLVLTNNILELNGITAYWKDQLEHLASNSLQSGRISFSLIEFKNLEKNTKADLYFTVSLGTSIVPSTPRKAKDTSIGIEDALVSESDEDVLYIVMYSKSKSVNGLPLDLATIPLSSMARNQTKCCWVDLEGSRASVKLRYHYATRRRE